ncbi:MAG: DUF547 domain-containing protein [Chitinophagaceae bacterium]|nr:DUF547 domain-containing protein [Chitinophagaceae bacterium]
MMPQVIAQSADPTTVGQQLLLAVRTADSGQLAHYRQQLGAASPGWLEQGLPDQASRLAFWLNLYNAATQWLLAADANAYRHRQRFFARRQILVAGTQLSLNDIEHGILRQSRIWWSMGYLKKCFPPAHEKRWRLPLLDYRLHFALNCGAASCPPIAFYEPEKIETQLALAERVFLRSAVQYNAADHAATVPKTLSWFRADFGGAAGIRRLLQRQQLIPAGEEGSKVRLRYAPYNWQLQLQNFRAD